MFTYLFCGQTIQSSIPLPELLRADQADAKLFFKLERPQERSIDQPWSHHWLSPDGEKSLSYRWQDSCHWLRFPGLADFLLSAHAERISCFPFSEMPLETIRHLLLDQVLPRCLAHQGQIMLHASAVRLELGLILLVGDSGAGKSTLAGNFHRAGHPAISDDCVWVKENDHQILAVPSYGGLRLWDDSLEVLFPSDAHTPSMAHYSSKKRVTLNKDELPESGTGIPILAVIVLSPADPISASDVSLDRLSRRETFIAMLKQTFQLDLRDLERMTRHTQALGRIVPMLPSYQLSMPRDYDLLPVVRQKILDAVL